MLSVLNGLISLPLVLLSAQLVRGQDASPSSNVKKAGYALPLAFGNEKSSEDLGGDGLPFLIIMDKFGRVRLVHNGYDRSEPLQSELSKVIEALLNEC